MSLTRTQDLPKQKLVSRTWDKKYMSSFSNRVTNVTKQWSIFVYLTMLSLIGTFSLEAMNRDVSVGWYVILFALIGVTAFLESPYGKPVITGKPKKNEEPTTPPQI